LSLRAASFLAEELSGIAESVAGGAVSGAAASGAGARRYPSDATDEEATEGDRVPLDFLSKFTPNLARTATAPKVAINERAATCRGIRDCTGCGCESS
jgi:hypothetical protein